MPVFSIASVVDVRHVAGFVVRVSFDDGVEGTVDLQDLIGMPHFRGLGPTNIGQVEVTGGGIGWPDGPDISPELLYERTLKRPAGETNDDGWKALREHSARMPEICRFFGIIIRMYFDDHSPPHFHAEYGDEMITVQIDGNGINGQFPASRLPVLFEWRDRHRDELMTNWNRLRSGESPLPIAPLD